MEEAATSLLQNVESQMSVKKFCQTWCNKMSFSTFCAFQVSCQLTDCYFPFCFQPNNVFYLSWDGFELVRCRTWKTYCLLGCSYEVIDKLYLLLEMEAGATCISENRVQFHRLHYFRLSHWKGLWIKICLVMLCFSLNWEKKKTLTPLPKADRLDLVFNVFRSLQQHLLVEILNCTLGFCFESVCVLGWHSALTVRNHYLVLQ